MGRMSLRDVGPDARETAGTLEDGLEHRLREAAGERVLLARVVRAQQRVPADRRLSAVGEPRLGAGRLVAERRQGLERGLPADGTERDDHAEVGEQLDLADEVR